MATPAEILECPVEIFIEIMSNIPHILLLVGVAEAVRVVYKEPGTSRLSGVLKESLPPQLRGIMADVYAFGYKDRSKMINSFTVAVDDIELLVSGFIWSSLRKRGLSPLDYPPDARPSEIESYRIRRAFWREKLFLVSTRQQPDLKSVNIEWFNRLNAWEREEMECVSRYLEHADKLTPHHMMSKKRTFPNLFGGAPEDYLSWSPLASTDDSCFWENVLGLDIRESDEGSTTSTKPSKVDRSPDFTGWENLLGTEMPNEGFRYFNAIVLEYNDRNRCGDRGRAADKILDRSRGWGYCFWDEDRLKRWAMLPSLMDPHTLAKWKASRKIEAS